MIMMKCETTASFSNFLPWRFRRKFELMRLSSLSFARQMECLFVQDGVPSASLTAVGDMAFAPRGGGIPAEIEQFVTLVDPIVADSDLRIGNLETPLTDAQKSGQSIGSLLRASPDAVSLLVAARMDVVTLANNHARDCRISGLLDCCKLLDEYGIHHCGAGSYSAQSQSPSRIEVAGLNIAVLGYCDNYRIEADESENQAPLSAEDGRILEDIRRLRPQVDLIIVQLHWGYEFAFHPPISYRDRARNYAEAGADLVLCHHAHLLMGVEVWNKSIISHGLGNFIFPPDAYLREGHPWTNRSYALKVFVNLTGILRAEVVPLVITDYGLPKIATGSPRAEILAAVARTSFRLNDDGFLHWIEKDRTLRDTLAFLKSFLDSSPPIDREMALQLRSPFRQANTERLRTAYGRTGEHTARLLSEIAESSTVPEAVAQFTTGKMRTLLLTAMTDLQRLNRLPSDLPGRVP